MRRCFEPTDRRIRLLVVKSLKSRVASDRLLTRKAKKSLRLLLLLASVREPLYRYAMEFFVDRRLVTEDQLDDIVTECAERSK